MQNKPTDFILASASPRRIEMLRREGCRFRAVPAAHEPEPEPGAPPQAEAIRIARAKAAEVFARFPEAVVLGADTMVCIDEDILGKPKDNAEAVEMLRRLSGRTHEVFTGVYICVPGGEAICFAEKTEVTFRALSEAEIIAYAETGEPLDKAGAYGIQGGGRLFVERVEGDYDNVVGLPMERLRQWIIENG